ncbi:amphi-Trp domain-containing protein [Myxococcota bacterium]|nr:amphi-Trp domain-containing protein [Myxococcota bacterium]MBU1612799.1 amphi-Trp domain-containing protein [Pseudomonadota bacterium]
MASEEFKHESMQDQESVVKYLQTLADGFQRGSIEFHDGTQQLELRPHGLLELRIRARQKGDRSKLVLKLVWKNDHKKNDSGSLSISI